VDFARNVRVFCLTLFLLPAIWTFPPYAREAYIRQAAEPHAFNLVAWEVRQLGGRLPDLLGQIARPPDPAAASPTAEQADAVKALFAAADRWQQARARRAPNTELTELREDWLAARVPAQTAIAKTLAALAVRERLLTPTPFGSWLLPPVSFLWSEPPRVLVVSPRERIEVSQSVLLRPEMTEGDMAVLEQQADSQGVVSLVVTIGGIATYPAIVPLQATPQETLSAVAHEWLHGYLLFHPLGQAYFTNYDARTLNETVADLAGRELGASLAELYGIPKDPPRLQASRDDARGFDFRGEMRATRLRVDELLAAGDLELAEQYLEERRQAFVAAGYSLRKLNQAYFAFHGSYGESAAAVSPVDEHVRQLRAQSGDLGTFLRHVSQMTSTAEVGAALGAEGARS
jgi:hypothetical protein